MRSHMTRRLFLGAGATAAMAATAGPMLAQQPAPASPAPRVKGPRVELTRFGGEFTAFAHTGNSSRLSYATGDK